MRRGAKIGVGILAALIILFVLGILIIVIAGSDDGIGGGNVAVIAIHGPISASDATKLSGKAATADNIIELVKKAEDSSAVKAILLDINSPGGTAVGSAEIAEAIKNAKKPTVAVIREYGASGAYWIATAADHVIANRASITGSIGVIASSLEFGEFIEEYNISYRRMVAGRLKDIGTPYRSMTDEENMLFQQSLDELHAIFKEEVAANRNLPMEKVDELATGMFYTGEQALALGLVDQLGTKEEAKKYLEQQLGVEVEFTKYEKPKTLAEVLFSSFQDYAFTVGMGMGESVVGDGVVEVKT